MVLSSSAYFIFLVGVFFLYWPVARIRALALGVILLANYFFYAKWDLFYLFLIPAASTCDYAIALGIADPERLGVMGASYGGYMTDWIVTQTSRFKAASTGASISDLAQQYYLSDAGEIMAEYFGLPRASRHEGSLHRSTP